MGNSLRISSILLRRSSSMTVAHEPGSSMERVSGLSGEEEEEEEEEDAPKSCWETAWTPGRNSWASKWNAEVGECEDDMQPCLQL
ncbi:MAG: hypothetical protein Q8P67_27080 [archaeon]|nr:hypothetical protein [archaeon]